MKPVRLQDHGFTLIEMLLAVAIGSLMLAAIMAASICLQRSFSAVDSYFASHVQQVRIIDYLSRDVRRSYIVTTSTDLQTVTCTIPNYLVDNGSNQPTRATPTLALVGNKVVANYQASTVNNVTLLAALGSGFLLILLVPTPANLSSAPVFRREPRSRAFRIAFWGIAVRPPCRTRQVPRIPALPLR